jgi:hypothetical protein
VTYNIFYHGNNRWEVWALESLQRRPKLVTRLKVIVPCLFLTKRGAGGWAQAEGRLRQIGARWVIAAQ